LAKYFEANDHAIRLVLLGEMTLIMM